MRLPQITLSKEWHWYAVLVGLLTAGYALTPALHKGMFFAFLSFLPVAAILYGMKWAAGEFKRPWAMWAVGQTFFAIGDLLAYTNPHYKFPGPEDALYIATYAFMIGGAVMLLDRYRDTALAKTRLDEWLVGIGSALATAAGVLAVTVHSLPHISETAVALSYPALDVSFLVMLYALRPVNGDRKLFSDEHLRRTFFILWMGVVALTLTDALYAFDTLFEGYLPGGNLDVGWLLYYLALGTVAMTRPADRPFRTVMLPKLTLESLSSSDSFEIIDLHTGNTVASFHTHEEARHALNGLAADQGRESLVIIRFDEHGKAHESEGDVE